MQVYPVAHIDLAALKHNLSIAKRAAPNSKVMSVIKANAYGHGDIEVAKALSASDAFAVARLPEAIRLREGGIDKPIVLFEGLQSVHECQLASDYQLSTVFYTLEQLSLLSEAKIAKPLPFCWLMVETGMHRLGLNEREVENAYSDLEQSRDIEGQIGLMSHFANADVIGDERNNQALARMLVLADKVSAPVSMANSAAILSLPESHQDWIRPGIMLYGSSPFADKTAQDCDLKSVMTLQAQLISISDLSEGDEVGYGGDWQADAETRVGIVNIGYGDGYNRILSNHSQLVIDDQVLPIIGRVSMDMIAVDLSLAEGVKVGDIVTLWGDQQLTIDQIAKQAHTISYELLCQVNQRVTRQYNG